MACGVLRVLAPRLASSCVRVGGNHLTLRRGLLFPRNAAHPAAVPLRAADIVQTPLQRMTGTCLFFLYSSGCTTLVPGMRKADAECLSAKLTHGGSCCEQATPVPYHFCGPLSAVRPAAVLGTDASGAACVRPGQPLAALRQDAVILLALRCRGAGSLARHGFPAGGRRRSVTQGVFFTAAITPSAEPASRRWRSPAPLYCRMLGASRNAVFQNERFAQKLFHVSS